MSCREKYCKVNVLKKIAHFLDLNYISLKSILNSNLKAIFFFLFQIFWIFFCVFKLFNQIFKETSERTLYQKIFMFHTIHMYLEDNAKLMIALLTKVCDYMHIPNFMFIYLMKTGWGWSFVTLQNTFIKGMYKNHYFMDVCACI